MLMNIKAKKKLHFWFGSLLIYLFIYLRKKGINRNWSFNKSLLGTLVDSPVIVLLHSKF